MRDEKLEQATIDVLLVPISLQRHVPDLAIQDVDVDVDVYEPRIGVLQPDIEQWEHVAAAESRVVDDNVLPELRCLCGELTPGLADVRQNERGEVGPKAWELRNGISEDFT